MISLYTLLTSVGQLHLLEQIKEQKFENYDQVNLKNLRHVRSLNIPTSKDVVVTNLTTCLCLCQNSSPKPHSLSQY